MNQKIKLFYMDNHYASCSNDKKICIWSSFENHNNHINVNEAYKLENALIGNESEFISFFELSQNLIFSNQKSVF